MFDHGADEQIIGCLCHASDHPGQLVFGTPVGESLGGGELEERLMQEPGSVVRCGQHAAPGQSAYVPTEDDVVVGVIRRCGDLGGASNEDVDGWFGGSQCEHGDRQESGSYGAGGREGYARFIAPDAWRAQVDEALRQALVNLEAEPAPAGEMEVVLGPGWTGVLLHEAVGHGLEGDFNRKGTSAFAGRIGERVAAPGVTVIDDGTIAGRRGSLSVDDEGTPTSRTVLIEDGILKGYLQDRLNARLMGAAATGNGRRESFAHQPMPRMTNTFMTAGDKDPEEILRTVKDGIYAVNFSGGQVDITSGKFVFNCTEAYRVKNGKVGAPIKNAALIGDGPSVLTKVSMIGNDFKLDPGVGVCGKAGQGVPVGVGQPTIKIDRMTVGGAG